VEGRTKGRNPDTTFVRGGAEAGEWMPDAAVSSSDSDCGFAARYICKKRWMPR
jgi:hypothetical protein